MKTIHETKLIVIRIGSVEYTISTGRLLKHANRFIYEIEEPVFSKTTQSAYYDAFYYVQNRLTDNDVKKNIQGAYYLVEKLMKEALKLKGYELSKAEEVKVVYYLYRDLIGLGMIESLYSEPAISYISCNGLGRPVHAYHNEYGWVETNIVFKNNRRLGSFVWRLLKKCPETRGTKGILPDGSFVETDSAFGFQIFKSKINFTPEFLIKNKMATPAAVAFLDSLIRHNKNIMIIGQKSSGKTMFLSGLLHMSPVNRRICIVEKAPHIAIDNLNWSASVSRVKDPKIMMMEFFRAKPDYIVADELDERSAKTVFSLMNAIPMIVTADAGNTDVGINRIVTKFGVAKSMIANIDAIVMLSPKRDIEEIIEIHNYDRERNEINAKVVFMKQRNKLVALESRFMRTLGESDKREMQEKAKELHLLSKKS
ncbi:MAG: ATPase, T2SS/T4P/T4SS family [Candidatus Nanoarchaeia archaeon]|nr:ATPase, T2SS/T4P/T4SS family [Candidatus Nanoarchaeia archaeon]MDD5238955.1 ATPase, T2SS/T4P/T4SS family [Candidatus Nanoarchaeia archaeon]